MNKFEEFFASYIETALWASMDNSDPETGGDPMDSNYGSEDIAPAALKSMRADCRAFLARAECFIDAEPAQTYRQAAHDFWLTRNGHGAGFWDGDWPVYGDKLTAISEAAGDYDLYVGDDGKVWGAPG